MNPCTPVTSHRHGSPTAETVQSLGIALPLLSGDLVRRCSAPRRHRRTSAGSRGVTVWTQRSIRGRPAVSRKRRSPLTASCSITNHRSAVRRSWRKIWGPWHTVKGRIQSRSMGQSGLPRLGVRLEPSSMWRGCCRPTGRRLVLATGRGFAISQCARAAFELCRFGLAAVREIRPTLSAATESEFADRRRDKAARPAGLERAGTFYATES